MKKYLIIALVTALLLPLGFSHRLLVQAQKTSGDEQRLLEIAAKSRGVSVEELELLNSAVVTLPLTKRSVTTGKIVLLRSDEVFATSMDENGEEVKLDSLRGEEDRAYAAKYGKLDPVLYDHLQNLRDGIPVKVAFWLNQVQNLDTQDFRDGRDISSEEADRYRSRQLEQVKRAVLEASTGFRQALERVGLRIEEASLISPLVYTTLYARQLTELTARADVQRVYLAESVDEDYMDVAAPSIKADDVWSAGITGKNAKIAIVEDSRVDFNNSCLANNLGTRVPGDSNVDNHATATAGMAASTNNTFRGIAYGAGIYSANGTDYGDTNMSAALDAGATNAHILNNSWGPNCGNATGSMNVHARHADYIVRYLWDTVVAAAGNNGNCSGFEFVGGVATGYNVIAVGNYDDKGTITVSDNTMNSSSSYKDPTSTHSDREKPEVAAPGTSITSLVMAPTGNCATGNVGSGTSYSSPMVAGIAGLLMEAKPALKLYPESVKALIMAGARDNVEGAARLSEYDGAGGVDAFSSYNSAINNQYKWMYVTPSTFDASGYITIDMGTIEAKKRVKVALVWDSTPSSDYTTDSLKADLDLKVTGPGVTKWSLSWDNSYEVVDFTVPTTGKYTIKIKNFSFKGTNEYVAVAWTK